MAVVCMAACPIVSPGLLVGFCAIEVARGATSRADPAGWRAAMWVSIASDAACAAALQQALDDYGVVDTDALQAVLEIPEAAAGLARALCTALQAAPPVMVDASTMASAVASSDAGVSAVVRTRDVGSTATFSPTGARLVAKEVQASPRVRTSEAQTLGATGTADTGASPDKVTMVDASTSHYLVPGIGLAHGGTQTEPSSRWEKGVAALAEAKEREAAVQQLVVQARCTAEATAREAAAAAADRAAAAHMRAASADAEDKLEAVRGALLMRSSCEDTKIVLNGHQYVAYDMGEIDDAGCAELVKLGTKLLRL